MKVKGEAGTRGGDAQGGFEQSRCGALKRMALGLRVFLYQIYRAGLGVPIEQGVRFGGCLPFFDIVLLGYVLLLRGLL